MHTFLLVAYGIIFVCFLLGLLYLAQGPPYVPSADHSVTRMLELIKTQPATHILDMGSGDGKLLIALVQQGYKVTGIEVSPLLVWRSRRTIKRLGLQDRATVLWGNFWRYDTSKYDVVVLFVIKHIMPRLEGKLKAELKPGTRVISNFFVFPKLKPTQTIDDVTIYTV